jgi:PPOX class probable F420-dependent enzyme
MGKLSDAERAFVRDNPSHAVLTTLRPDGTPHSTVIWVDEADGELLFNTARGRAKERYLAADPRATITVLDPADPYRWISVSGPVRVTSEGGDAGIDALARKYTGADFASRREGETRVNARLTPERIDAHKL